MINLLNRISRGKVTFRFFNRKFLFNLLTISIARNSTESFTYTLLILITIKISKRKNYFFDRKSFSSIYYSIPRQSFSLARNSKLPFTLFVSITIKYSRGFQSLRTRVYRISKMEVGANCEQEGSRETDISQV